MRAKRRKRGLSVLLTAALVLTVVCAVPVEASASDAGTEPFVIVLDPGHGGNDGGASRTWGGKQYREKDLNLTIAKYCKKELERYVGVKVYLTRSTDRHVSLNDRVSYAKKQGADLFVSLHNNADTKSSRNGACVFYPNYNYEKQIGVEGRTVALSIEKELVALGLKNLGVAYRNSENRTRYPDNKLADYYLVIKQSKLNGFPGLIVEHAYVSNPSDCKNYLGTSAKLKKLGVADATGIAKAYGLVKGSAPVLTDAKLGQDGAVELAWTECGWAKGYTIYRSLQGEAETVSLAVVSGSKNMAYTDATAAPGVTYEYWVRAFVTKKGVTRYTEASNAQSVTTLGVPESVAVSRTEEGQAMVSFTPVEGADGYLVARRSGDGESFLVVAELDSAAFAWTDEESAPEDAFEYQVCAYVVRENMRITGAYTPAVWERIETGAEPEPEPGFEPQTELETEAGTEQEQGQSAQN